MIIPSIDIMNGKSVQLQQGKKKVLEREDVFKLVEEFKVYGEIAIVDLDAALGKGSNLGLIKKICKIAPCRVGGGIRSEQKANALLSAGAKKIIIGTKASPDFLKKLPKDRIIVAIDTKDSVVVDKGWRRKTTSTPVEKIKELKDYCSEFLFTNVNKEGMLQGCDLKIIRELASIPEIKLTIAGGISTYSEIKKIESLHCNSQLGMALYTNKISLSKAFVSVLDFKKYTGGLIPTIVQDDSNRVLMLAYSSKKSLSLAFELKKRQILMLKKMVENCLREMMILLKLLNIDLQFIEKRHFLW